MGLSVLAAFLGIGIASWWYLKSTDIPDQLAERFAKPLPHPDAQILC